MDEDYRQERVARQILLLGTQRGRKAERIVENIKFADIEKLIKKNLEEQNFAKLGLLFVGYSTSMLSKSSLVLRLSSTQVESIEEREKVRMDNKSNFLKKSANLLRMRMAQDQTNSEIELTKEIMRGLPKNVLKAAKAHQFQERYQMGQITPQREFGTPGGSVFDDNWGNDFSGGMDINQPFDNVSRLVM